MKIKIFPRGKTQWAYFVLRWVSIIFLGLGFLNYMTKTPGDSYSGSFTALNYSEKKIRDDLQNYVLKISHSIGERNLSSEAAYLNLQETSAFISNEFKSFGYNPLKQSFSVGTKSVNNVEAIKTGNSSENRVVVIGAHYDSVPGCPGANDNASGVAALLVIAEQLSKQSFPVTIKFVAFVNEEPPYFQTDNMGSLRYADRARRQEENIIAMISLETIGYYSDEEKSQQYPVPFNLFYPGTGNFIAFVGNLGSRNLMLNTLKSFRDSTSFPSEGIAAPQMIEGIGWSDHWSFWKADYDAIMITDTAPFRYKYYHTREDTYEKLDYSKIARVVHGIIKVVISNYGNK